jgi:hypothetical protein
LFLIRLQLLEHQRNLRLRSTAASPSPPANPARRTVQVPARAAQKQRSGLSRLSSLYQEIAGSATPTPSDSQPEMTESEKEAERQRLEVEDERLVDDEIRRYSAAGIIRDDSVEMEDFDILRYWQVRNHGITDCVSRANCLQSNRPLNTSIPFYSAPH